MHLQPNRSQELRTVLWSFVLCVAIAGGLLLLFFAFTGRAEADEVVIDERTEDESPNLDQPLAHEVLGRSEGERPMARRSPFTPYASDPGAYTFEDLSADERADFDASAEWAETDSGDEVHQAYKRATAWGVAHARAKAAEGSVGLEGVESLGVE